MLGSFRTAARAPSALLLMVIDPACVSRVYMYGSNYPFTAGLGQNSTLEQSHRP
jgi:hypothetical protein